MSEDTRTTGGLERGAIPISTRPQRVMNIRRITFFCSCDFRSESLTDAYQHLEDQIGRFPYTGPIGHRMGAALVDYLDESGTDRATDSPEGAERPALRNSEDTR